MVPKFSWAAVVKKDIEGLAKLIRDLGIRID